MDSPSFVCFYNIFSSKCGEDDFLNKLCLHRCEVSSSVSFPKSDVRGVTSKSSQLMKRMYKDRWTDREKAFLRKKLKDRYFFSNIALT